jgi:hypothetical protein
VALEQLVKVTSVETLQAASLAQAKAAQAAVDLAAQAEMPTTG